MSYYKMQPNKSPEPTAVGAVRSASRFTSQVGGGSAFVVRLPDCVSLFFVTRSARQLDVVPLCSAAFTARHDMISRHLFRFKRQSADGTQSVLGAVLAHEHSTPDQPFRVFGYAFRPLHLRQVHEHFLDEVELHTGFAVFAVLVADHRYRAAGHAGPASRTSA